MNAAFLMLASACLGDAPAAPAVAPANPCNVCCDDHCRPRWCDRIRDWFHRRDCCDHCRPACPQPCRPVCCPQHHCRPVCCPQPCPQPVCHQHHCRPVHCCQRACCKPCCPPPTCCKPCPPPCRPVCCPQQHCRPVCQPCPPVRCCHTRCHDACHDHCGGFLDRLRGLFRRHDCCDHCYTTTTVRTGENIPAPKPMPKGGEPPAQQQGVRIITPAPTTVPATAPSLEAVPPPAIVPSAGQENRNPF